MGVYLSSPVTEKESIDEKCDGFVYGASSMQGWRTTQEDAHNCIPVFDKDSKTSFFAVYDGHGGSEVAKYCARHFPDFIKNLMETNGGMGEDPSQFIQSAFLAFDATLTREDVIKELKELAGKDDDNDEEDEDDPVGRTETDMLKEEATMPLDQLLAQYNTSTPEERKHLLKKENVQSPALKAKCGSTSDGDDVNQDSENGPFSSTSHLVSSSLSPSQQDSVDMSTAENGVEDINNSNNRNELQNQSAVKIDSNPNEVRPSDNNNIVKSTNSSTADSNSEPGEASSSSSSTLHKNKVKSEGNGDIAESATSSSGGLAAGSSSSQQERSGKKAASSKSNEPTGSGSGSSSGMRSSKAKAAVDMAKMDGAMDSSEDDDDDEEEEETWEDVSDDDDDDDDEEDEDVDGPDEDVPMMDMTNEEPGSDSGCTACVMLMQGKKLMVANAGDSRCILSRAGKAVELSFDHKPEDDTEKDRIEKAGGKVTADGRVNGGLNLSRAIGDHVYKRTKHLPAKEQMITALPDVESATLCDEDQFIVIACDGIWNYLSSQEVVDYVLEKLKDEEAVKKPSIVCEKLFDHCLAPNTFGDGTGCDNMTCIILILDTFDITKVKFAEQDTVSAENAMDGETSENSEKNSLIQKGMEEAGTGPLKRCPDNVEVSEGKRLKIEEEVA